MVINNDSLAIKQFHTQLDQLISDCSLSPGQVYYILKNTLTEVEQLYNQLLAQEYTQALENQKTKEEQTQDNKEKAGQEE